MKFFDRILKGLGFEVDDSPKQNQTRGIKNVDKVDLQNFNIDEETDFERLNALQKRVEPENKIINVKPQSLSEIQDTMDLLIKGNNIIIDLSEFNKEDIVRILDFISGVCYALNAEIQKADEVIYKLLINRA
ncbi:MAG: cell division protein SepF [Clostridia bacterium]|nr:cell division protein SepF [Clostridia bacterium]MDD4685864.1 cell division protein SepF [Clostridia bacterium]